MRLVYCDCLKAIKGDAQRQEHLWTTRGRLIIAKDQKPIRRLKFGSMILQCACCGRHHLVEETAGVAAPLSPRDLDLIEKWNRERCLPTPEQRRILAEIGATPTDLYGNGRAYITFPCEGRLKGEPYITNFLVRFQKFPPVEQLLYLYGHRTYRFITEVDELWPSELVLSREVRYATTRAEEISMGFAPTIIMAPNGREYLLNGTSNFFWRDGFKGSKMVLKPYEGEAIRKKAMSLPYTEDSRMTIFTIVGDWDDELERLRISVC